MLNRENDQFFAVKKFIPKIIQLNCHPEHIFHKKCILKLVNKHGNKDLKCPLCRTNFKYKDA